MTPLLFGPPERRLFGIYSAPATAPTAAVLLCPPVGQELLRAHRFHRVLSDRLLRLGVAVLRFDYYGTGDSGGDSTEGDLEGWTEDVGTAHAELVRQVGDLPITWYGARMGATLAAAAAARGGIETPDRLVLWDTVLDGADWLRELCREHLSIVEQFFCIPPRDLRRRFAANPEAFADSPLGFEMSARLLDQLHRLSADSVDLPRHGVTTVIAAPVDQRAQAWAGRQAGRGVAIETVLLRHALIWFADAVPGNALVPAEGLQVLLKHLRPQATA